MYFDNNFPNFAYKIQTDMQMQCTDQGEYARNNLENFSQTTKRQEVCTYEKNSNSSLISPIIMYYKTLYVFWVESSQIFGKIPTKM